MSDALPPNSGPNYFSDAHAPAGQQESLPRRGLVNHVRIVALLNAAQGAMEAVPAGFSLFTGSVSFLMGDLLKQQAMQQGQPNPEAMPIFVAVFYLTVGVCLLVLVVLRFIAAVRNYFFAGRTLGIVSLCLGLLSSFTGCCSITSIGVAVYGLVVLFNPEVIEAFHLRQEGRTADEVLNTFASRPV